METVVLMDESSLGQGEWHALALVVVDAFLLGV
jgi:hypothetical protein